MACIAGFGAYAPTAPRRRRDAQAIDALLIDETIEMPRDIVALITAGKWKFPVVGIQLDAAAQAKLVRVLDNSHVIVGISSGATLFCLERIAWDHGFRLTGRSQRCAGDAGLACRQDAAAFLGAFLGGAQPTAANSSLIARAYRPSRADATLHTWVMRKSAREV